MGLGALLDSRVASPTRGPVDGYATQVMTGRYVGELDGTTKLEWVKAWQTGLEETCEASLLVVSFARGPR